MRYRIDTMNLDITQLVSSARIDGVGERHAWLRKVRRVGSIHRGEEISLPLRVVEQTAPAFLQREIIETSLFVKRQHLYLLIRTDIEPAYNDVDFRTHINADR